MKNIKREYYFISILFILFVILTIFVSLGKLDTIDKVVFDNIIRLKNASLTGFLYVITQLASTIGTFALLLIISFIFIKHKSFSDFKYVIINVASGVVLMYVIKNIIRRIRPTWKWITQGGFSYPSGHTISSVLLYGTLILLVNKKISNVKLKRILTIMLCIMIVLTGVSRIYFGVHYLSDVLGSILLGSIILIISNIFMNREFNNDKSKIKETI